MRTAALPTFRKLYRRLNRTEEGFGSGLPSGNYSFLVEYSMRASTEFYINFRLPTNHHFGITTNV